MIETNRSVVYPHQLDHMGHMNVQWYTAKFDEGTWHFLSQLGITSAYIRENQKGMAALEQRVKYKAEVTAGDLILIKTQPLEMSDKVVRFIHHMYNAETGQEVANCENIGVHFDRNSRKSCPFPEPLRENWLQLTSACVEDSS